MAPFPSVRFGTVQKETDAREKGNQERYGAAAIYSRGEGGGGRGRVIRGECEGGQYL